MFNSKKKILGFVILLCVILVIISFFIISKISSSSKINYATDLETLSENELANISNELKITKNDLILGSPSAPVTIISYDSFSCVHCASFFENVFPLIKQNYIETGKVMFVNRDFPLDSQSLSASKLVRCFAKEQESLKVFNAISGVFAAQKDWLNAEGTNEGLIEIFNFLGMKEAEINECLKDEELENTILEERLRASKTLKIMGTPTFFINGVKFQNNSYAEFEKAIENLLQQ